METFKELLAPKSFSHFGFIVVIGSLVTGIILFGVVTNIETSEQRYFRCEKNAKDRDSLQTTKCFAKYQAETTRGFPLYGFVLLNVLLATMVCFCYSQSVSSTVKDLEREDLESEMLTNQSSSCRLYRMYCIQLAVRFTLGIIFLILQWGAFYPLSFPSEYVCDFSNNHQVKHANITSGDGANITRSFYDCHNPQAVNKTFCTIIFFIIYLFLTAFILAELVNVIRKAHMNADFRTTFFNIYLQNRNDYEVIESYLANTKESIKKSTKYYEPLLPNRPGEGKKLLELDNIYTNLIMYPGRARNEFAGKRHEIFEGYLKSQQNHSSINTIKGIFAPNPENPQERPRSIMIVGRPGIGKSLLCLKILRDWACDKTFNEETEEEKRFEFVFHFKFRLFNDAEEMNLKQLLGKASFSKAFPNEVYSWIRRHPGKVLLIFDGLDEFGEKENFFKEEEFESDLEKKIPFSALYYKLTFGQLFEGATVVTTSRPTALSYVAFDPNKEFDRTLEGLGFDQEKIADYVEKFFQDSGMQQKIWNHISSNANLLSLCYIPVNCHIVSFSLKKGLTHQVEPDDEALYLPTTLTEIYEDALKLIVYKHNPVYRCPVPEQEELLSSSDADFAPDVEMSLKSLGEIAHKGIEEDRLIFESKEVKKHENCGLLHRLPDEQAGKDTLQKRQYCFLHLTIQELLAARYLVSQFKRGNVKKELQSWIAIHVHEGKWEVVMQFVAGFLHHEEDDSLIEIFIDNLPRPFFRDGSWPSFGQNQVVLNLSKCKFEISRSSKHGWQDLLTDALSAVVNVQLNNSSLTDADLTSIVFVLRELKSIETLVVSYNHITFTGCLEVVKLLKMTGSDALATNKCKLTTLNIRGNQIGDDGVKHLSDALATNKCKLTTLNIRGNQIGGDGVEHLSDALAKNECKLTTLNIGGNRIGDDGLKHLSAALAKNECKLTTLNIGDNRIGDDGLKHLSAALATNECKLTTLDMSGNRIGDDGVKYLSAALAKNECKLTTLDISINRIGDDGLKHLSAALATNECKLTTLGISINRIGDDGLKHLSNALAANECKLTTLNIGGNRIGDDGLKYLSDALAKNESKLTTLDISNNQIGDDGVKHLSRSLATNECKLTTLDINNNQIVDDGLKHLSDALAANECKLTRLVISNNQIGDDGVKHLSDALAANECKLTRLVISNNQIGDDGVKYLSAALAKNECKLTTLDISNNQIGEDGVKHLSDALATNECKLTTLEIRNNRIGDDRVTHLSDALAANERKLTTLNIHRYRGSQMAVDVLI